MIKKNITLVLRKPLTLGIWFFTTLGLTYLWYIYSDIEYVAANYRSYFFAYYDIFLSWLVIIFFPLILSGIVYRALLFGKKKGSQKVSGFLGVLSSIIGVFITGVACCGVSIISFLGLTSIIGFLEIFPYHGIELKTFSISIMLYAWYDLYRTLLICKVKK